MTHRPRDLGLLLWRLCYKTDPAAEITPEVIAAEAGRCRMKAVRLAELQAEPYMRFWERMRARRAARLEHIREHGHPPPGGMPPQFQRYWHGGAQRLKAERTTGERLVKRIRARIRYGQDPGHPANVRISSLARALKETCAALAKKEDGAE